MVSTAPTVTAAAPQQLPRIAQSLQRAFHDDPMLLWVMDRARQRESR